MIFAFQPILPWSEDKIGNLRTAHSDTSEDGSYLELHTYDFPPSISVVFFTGLQLDSMFYTYICVYTCVQSR